MTDAYGFSWKWATPALAVVLATLLIGVASYANLPDRIPLHFDAAGTADRHVDTNVFSAFGLVMVQVLMLPLLFGASAARFRRHTNGPDYPTFGRTMLIFAACVQVTLLVPALVVWQLLPAGPWLLPMALAPCLGGVVWLLVQNHRHQQQGLETPPSRPG